MSTPFDMNYFLALGFIGVCIYFGVFLRARIRFLQKFLVPSCMIGGIGGMILMNLKLIPLEVELFQSIAYHFFIISFIGIGLTPQLKVPGQKGRGKQVARGAIWMGLINGGSMTSQALIGCLLFLCFGLVGFDFPLQFGLFLPLGYTQGPGQALAIGKAWEAAGLTNAITMGLAVAAVGFLFAFFVGIPLINWGIRRGFTAMGKVELPDYFKRGTFLEKEQGEPLGIQTTHSGNVDSLAFQVCAIGIVYMLTYGLYALLTKLFGKLDPAMWGFFFFWALLVGILVKAVMGKTGNGHLLDRGSQIRLTGLSVDLLLTATLISVKAGVVWEYIIPLLILCLLGGIWTTFYVLYFGRRSGEMSFERMIVQYGVNTGTVSTGLLLLRVVDPEFKTTAALETGLYSLAATPFITGVMVVIAFGPKWGLNVYHQIGIYLGLLALILALLKLLGFWKKRVW